jgi:ribosomal protein L24E
MAVYKEVNEMPRCGSCGKLLTTGGLEVERLEQTLIFCNDRCLEVFDTYKVPKYGNDAVWPESVVG